MIRLDWKRFFDDAVVRYVLQFVYGRQWFGWWFASYCSAHVDNDLNCHQCRCGSWKRNSRFQHTIITHKKYDKLVKEGKL